VTEKTFAIDGDPRRAFRLRTWGDDVTEAELRAATEALTAYLTAVRKMMHDFIEAYRPILEAYATELGAVVQSITDFAEAVQAAQRPPHDRPAWMSPHGPAPRGRGRRARAGR
jgi:hypothetical protein